MKRKYELTPEHRARLPEWRDRWIRNAMGTAPMTDEDRRICSDAVRGMYAGAGFKPPIVVFVRSPFVLRFAGGFAAAIWYLRKNGLPTEQATEQATGEATGEATEQATEQATREATREATRQATWQATEQETREPAGQATEQPTGQGTWQATEQATWQATEQATEQATGEATWQATWQATRQATEQATREATRQATREATRQATWQATGEAMEPDRDWFVTNTNFAQLAEEIGVGEFGLMCAEEAYRMWQGGNQWSGYDSFLSFFDDAVELDLPEFEKYRFWRALSEHSGPRIVHEKFCMISDRPELLTVDATNRPHNDTGPFCRWRDGTELYSVHGVRVPAWVIKRPGDITPDLIAAEQNSETKRIMIERFGGSIDPSDGWDRYIAAIKPEIIDHDDRWGTLCRTPGGLALHVINRSPESDGTFRKYVLPVADQCEPLPDPGDPDGRLGYPQRLTALNAVASTFGMTGHEYKAVLGAES